MMRSLFSGVSGLKVHQTKMDVIGNNISNVNTVGFKASTVTFSDILYQTTQSASGPNETTGAAGKNAMQIGLGASIAGITTNASVSGGSQRTDNPFDVMINGDGFFVVKSGGTNYFTKAGAFQVDAAGTLCTSSGAVVMGWLPNEEQTGIDVGTVEELQIMSPDNLTAEPEATTEAKITGNIDKNDEQLVSTDGKPVQIKFYDNLGNTYTAQFSIKQSATNTSQYSVDLTDIVDKDNNSIFLVESTNASTGVVTTALNANLAGVTLGGITYTASYSAGELTFTHSSSNTLSFNPGTGEFASVGGTTATSADKKLALAINAGSGAGAAAAVAPFDAFNIDFSTITMYAASGTCSLEGSKGDLTGAGTGRKAGEMTGISIDAAGKIYGSYSNGTDRILGQIALATFANPSGLEAVGNNMFAETQNSGEFDGIGVDPSSQGNSLTTGVLEMSNVDLSQEFTTMITTQRGFQANSRIITTSDTMLEELINLKR
ncbi:flagellar hook protein FlgE [Anaeromicropila populeti]|uniref:Flagellar hook protein FlgE n=1 Tax=Anaeromicropila populeti TaxID=37658 RepID=A0A1I6KXA6_9FIRM|nr:flagellar hook protein FlgE [Anaeromicropila populeti]SFR95859.1 flagellar hook protein FlgE [Anaeromicropila populeti]